MKTRLLIGLCLVTVLAACRSRSVAPIITPTVAAIAAVQDTPTVPLATATATSTPTATPSPSPTSPPIRYGPDDFPVDVNPLTGLKVTNPETLERHPLGIKINLVPRTTNRPPWGLSLADIVYDFYHNDGYSRLHAIFYGQDAELVGPIRSGRLPDDMLVRMYKSVFAYGGADENIERRFFSSPYADRLVREGQRAICPPSPATPMCRFEPGGLDFLLAGTEALTEFIGARGVEQGRSNLDGMTFYPTPPEGGMAAQVLYTRFSSDNYSKWVYNPQAGRYMLSEDKVWDQGQGEEYEPLIDRLNDEQVGVENVVILVAPHDYYRRPPAEIVDILLSGSGPAYAFRDGEVYEVVWNRPTLDSVLFLTYADGERYEYKPGQTWYQIIGQSSLAGLQEDGSWRFDFRFP